MRAMAAARQASGSQATRLERAAPCQKQVRGQAAREHIDAGQGIPEGLNQGLPESKYLDHPDDCKLAPATFALSAKLNASCCTPNILLHRLACGQKSMRLPTLVRWRR
jgi:hypothetical protein